MPYARRSVLKTAGTALGTFAALPALGLLAGPQALAQTASAAPRHPGFQARTLAEALQQIRGSANIVQVDDQQIQLQIPELSENGAMVPVSVNSLIPGTRQIMLVIENNPFPLIASFHIPEGTEPGFQTRVKMAQSSRVLVLVQATRGPETRLYMTAKETRVTLGGC